MRTSLYLFRQDLEGNEISSKVFTVSYLCFVASHFLVLKISARAFCGSDGKLWKGHLHFLGLLGTFLLLIQVLDHHGPSHPDEI